MKVAGYVMLALIFLVGGYYAYEHFTADRDEKIELLEIELKAIKVQVKADSIESARRDSIYEADVLRLRAEADSAKEVAGAAVDTARATGERYEELAVRLIELTGGHPILDSLPAAHRAQVASYERAIVAYGTTIAAQDSVIAMLTADREHYKSANETLRDALRRSEELKDHWEREANPPFYIELWGDLPKLLIAGGIGWAVGKS